MINVVHHCFFYIISISVSGNKFKETVTNNIYALSYPVASWPVASWPCWVGHSEMAAASWPWQVDPFHVYWPLYSNVIIWLLASYLSNYAHIFKMTAELPVFSICACYWIRFHRSNISSNAYPSFYAWFKCLIFSLHIKCLFFIIYWYKPGVGNLGGFGALGPPSLFYTVVSFSPTC